MAETPKTPFPVISEGTVLRIKLGTLIAIFIAVIAGVTGGAVWATTVNDRLSRIEEALGIDAQSMHRAARFGTTHAPDEGTQK